MTNEKIRDYARKQNVYLWEIANQLGISEPTITRKLRIELSDEETKSMLNTIDVISKSKKEERN